MKKVMAIMLCVAFVFSCTGCSEVEIEHFDKSVYKDMSGVVNFDESVNITIDPENLANAVIEIQDELSQLEKQDNDKYAPEGENYIYPADEDAEMFVNEFLSAIRIALDENKMFTLEVDVKGAADFDNMISDENIICRFNNISIDCGNGYMRGDKIFINKKLFYTIGSINFMYDIEILGEYYKALDEMFGDNEYVVMSYENVGGYLGNTNFASSIIDSTNVLQKAQLDYYEQAKDILKNFDSECVTRIENGTRFQLKSSDFANAGNRFASYVRQHSESVSKLVNDYVSIIMAASMSMYGDEMNGMEYLFDNMNVTGDDIIAAMDGLKEMINSPEFSIIFKTLDITYTNDITEKDNSQNNVTVIKGSYNNKKAFSIETNINITNTESYEFADISNENGIEYMEFFEKLNSLQNDLMYGEYNYSLNNSYECPDCGQSFKYIDTYYCNKCGFVHDFYEGDENCDRQPGCELAKEATQIAA